MAYLLLNKRHFSIVKRHFSFVKWLLLIVKRLLSFVKRLFSLLKRLLIPAIYLDSPPKKTSEQTYRYAYRIGGIHTLAPPELSLQPKALNINRLAVG